MFKKNRVQKLAVVCSVGLLALAGCAQSAEKPAAATKQSAEAAEKAATAAISLRDGWAKAAEAGGMTAAFGVITNNSDADITLESASSDVSPMVELHETVKNDAGEMQMQQVQGGFVIPAKGTFELVPGGNHIMFMKLQETLSAGNDLVVTLHFSNGESLQVPMTIKDYAGANESYADGGHMGEHSGEHMGEHSDEHAGEADHS